MANPRDVYVDVTIKSINPLDFDVAPSSKNNPPLPVKGSGKPGQPDIVFRNNKHPGFNVHFELVGDTKGYFFPPNSKKKEAVWSQCGTVCPTTSGIWEVFEPRQVVEPVPPAPPNERRILIVHNANPPSPPAPQPQGAFKYNLRVTNDGGTTYLNLDPGGTNDDGSYTFTISYLTIAVLAIGATALVAIAETLHITNFFRW